MGMREELLRGIYAYGFEKPSAIQQRAILPCVKGLNKIIKCEIKFRDLLHKKNVFCNLSRYI